jgi:hypothetical protein
MAVHLIWRISVHLSLVALAHAQVSGVASQNLEAQQRFFPHRQSFFEHAESMARGGQQLPHALLQDQNRMRGGGMMQDIPQDNPFFTHKAQPDHHSAPWSHGMLDEYASQNRFNGWMGQDNPNNMLHGDPTPEERFTRGYFEQHEHFDKQTKPGERPRSSARWAQSGHPEHLDYSPAGPEDFHRNLGWASRDMSHPGHDFGRLESAKNWGVAENFQHPSLHGGVHMPRSGDMYYRNLQKGPSPEQLRKVSRGHGGTPQFDKTNDEGHHEAGKAMIRQMSQVRTQEIISNL